MSIIIFTQDEGLTISVIHPAPGVQITDCVGAVPEGAKYKFALTSDIPTDRLFREAWEVTVDATWVVKGA